VSQEARQLQSDIVQHAHIDIQAFMPAILDIETHGAIRPENKPHTKFIHDAYALPNIVGKITQFCFNNTTVNARNSDPIVHVLSKAWPMRCSIRNFNDIVSNYIRTVPAVYSMLLQMLHCCLAGRYPHRKQQVSFVATKTLYKYFVTNPISQQDFATWVSQSHQQIVFIAIKEYMVFAIDNVPGLQHALQNCHPWHAFASSVVNHADMIRDKINKNALCHASLFENVHVVLQHLKSFKCKPNENNAADVVLNVVRTVTHCDKNVYNVPLRCQLYHVHTPLKQLMMAANSQKTDAICDVIECIQTSQINSSTARARTTAIVQAMPVKDAFLLHEIMCARLYNANTALIPLPACILSKQKEKLQETPQKTNVHVCMCCRQVRAFVVDDATASKHAWACGSHKVLVDDCTGKLYCGKRLEKSSALKHKVSNARPDYTCRNYWKQQQNLMCKHSKLVEYEMLGMVLQLFGTLYMLCPYCLCLMVIRPERHNGGPLSCIHCQYKKHTVAYERCFHCYSMCTNATHMPIKQHATPVAICNACTKQWCSEHELTQHMPDTMVHRAINERWKTRRLRTEIQLLDTHE